MKCILMIDTERVSLLVGKGILSKDYMVITASSVEKGLDILKEVTPDLIMIGIEMPKISGFDVLEILKKDVRCCQIPVLLMTIDRSDEIASKCYEKGAVDFIYKPFVPALLLHRVRRSLELEDYRAHLEKTVSEQLNQITSLQNNIIVTLANIIESRDGTTGEHVKRTSAYTRLLIDKMMENKLYPKELTENYKEMICKAAPMHDIGKITVPDSILRKTDALSEEEFNIMKLHTVAGYDIIKKDLTSVAEREFVDVASKVARYHHERFDGKGYPDGLAGKDIPLCARILAVADVYDALTSKRSYKKAFTTEEALDIMNKNKGQFEPAILKVFTESEADLKALTLSLHQNS